MMANEQVWPDGVVTTLWNYGALQPARQSVLPFSGFRPDWNFMLAFAFGVVVIIIFAWQRFRQRSFNLTTSDYRVLRELSPIQLLATRRIRFAYYCYAGSLVLIYTGMTFFGGLILTAVNAIPMAGIQVEVDKLPLGNPQWPLTLAFGLAGFTSLLKPLDIAETWLRQQAHKLVGIPIKTKEYTKVLMANLREAIVAEPALEAGPLFDGKKLPQWVTTHIEKTDDIWRVVETCFELDRIIKLFREESRWPRLSIREELQNLEIEELTKAEIVIQDFRDILKENYRSTNMLPNQGETKDEVIVRHQRTLETKLDVILERAEQIGEELGAILTVYAERDRNYSAIENDKLRNVVRTTFPPEVARYKADAWTLFLAVPVFFAYLFATTLKIHSLLTNELSRSAATITATAVLETLRFVVTFWLPLFVALLLRHFMKKKDRWHPL